MWDVRSGGPGRLTSVTEGLPWPSALSLRGGVADLDVRMSLSGMCSRLQLLTSVSETVPLGLMMVVKKGVHHRMRLYRGVLHEAHFDIEGPDNAL